ncbi:MAG: hypothetical protein ACR2KJ_03430 [Jatrophihabitans sp.]
MDLTDQPRKPDLLLAGGAVIAADGTPAGVRDVAVTAGRITAIAADLPRGAGRVVDCSGALVLAGLIDVHSHVHDGVFDVAVPPDEGHLRRGVVAVNDAGSVGASGFPGFLRHTVATAGPRVVCFLNLSSVGLVNIHVSEYADPHAVDLDKAAGVAADHPDVVRGIKVRLSRSETGEQPLAILDQALQLGERTGLPLMAHVGATACGLDDILDRLRPGDIVTHSFHGKGEGLIQGGRVAASAWRAGERGVLFDVGHGTTQMSYAVARTAIAEGFLPDLIGSDLSRRNWMKPAYDLATIAAKMVALGMTREQVFGRVTVAAAEVLGLADEGYGRLTVGGPACITVLAEADTVVLPDAAQDQLQVDRFEPLLTVNHGAVVPPSPWRGR